MKHFKYLLATVACSVASSVASAQGWQHGIGTGFMALNAEGDSGFGTQSFGAVDAELNLDSSDVMDAMESGFGLAGFSTNGVWTFHYGAKRLKLEDSVSGTGSAGGPSGTPVTATVGFEATGAELSAEYKFGGDDRNSWSVLGGINFTKHDYEVRIANATRSVVRQVDNDWTDIVVGLIYSHGFTDRTSWTTRVDGGFGGSEGTYHAQTGINWRLGGRAQWLVSLYFDIKQVEFENGQRSDADWYLYDVKEFGPGLGFAYVFGG